MREISREIVAPTGRVVRERDEGRDGVVLRQRVRCPRWRDGCRGQLYLESLVGGHFFELICLHCSRSAGAASADELVERWGVDPLDLKRAEWRCLPFVWRKVTVSLHATLQTPEGAVA